MTAIYAFFSKDFILTLILTACRLKELFFENGNKPWMS
jgi:hypothetical protein